MIDKNKKARFIEVFAPIKRAFLQMVEAAGIEPASENIPRMYLHI